MNDVFYVKNNGAYQSSISQHVKVKGNWLKIIDAKGLEGIGEPSEPLKIFIVNDLHFKAGTDSDPNSSGATNGTDRYYYASPNNLRDFVSIVNTEKPDLVLALGDMLDEPHDLLLFNQIWNQIDNSVRKEVTLGNHDFDELTYTQLVDSLGYSSKIENGGSKFNQTYSLNESVRLIMLDATFDDNDNHGNHYAQVRVHTDTLNWLDNVLATSPQNHFVIGTHVAPHQAQAGGYFNFAQANQIRTILEKYPNKKTSWFYGHHHKLDIESNSSMGGSNHLGYLLPALILNEEGRFTEVTVTSSSLNLVKRDLDY